MAERSEAELKPRSFFFARTAIFGEHTTAHRLFILF